jgi:lysozyme
MSKVKHAVAVLGLSLAGLVGISSFEGTSLQAYRDPVGIVTICNGHTRTAKLGQTVTSERCAELLREDSSEAQQAVKRLVRVPVTQEQYDALVSFTFNVGSSNLASSTLLRKVNAGDCRGAEREFHRWNRAKGIVLPGLTKRRAAEAAMWESGC